LVRRTSTKVACSARRQETTAPRQRHRWRTPSAASGDEAGGAKLAVSCGILAIVPEMIREPSRVAAAGYPPATPAASPPPALSPITAMRPGSMPSSRLRGRPARPAGVGIFDGYRVRMLWCQPARQGHHRDAGPGDVPRTVPSKMGTEPMIIPPPQQEEKGGARAARRPPVPPRQQRGAVCRGDLVVGHLDVVSGRLRLIVEVLQHCVQRCAPGLHVADRRLRRRAAGLQGGLQDRGHLGIQGECHFRTPSSHCRAGTAVRS